MKRARWYDLGPAGELKHPALRQVICDGVKIALSYRKGIFAAVSGECNHVKGPIGKGRLKGDYAVCPWHGWMFHRKTGRGQPGYEKACLPRHEVKLKGARVFVNLAAENRREHEIHPPHPLARPIPARRAPGPIRVAGISTTAMEKANPRYSTSEDLLNTALRHASSLGAQTRLIKLNNLRFNSCGGFYSKDEHACTWPCTFTQMDPKDQLDKVYEALVFWADVVLVATPVRWGNPSALYLKMAERLNCIENQLLLEGRALIKNKTAAFIITGGQDNVQAVSGNMMTFFSSLGFCFPRFPFIATSRGWFAEDMERNNEFVKHNARLHKEARELARRSIESARAFLKR
jgi:multimeric flavodoxin WrbA/nitrite reductase/ring-hydroxylating ferredoxin subunit